MFFFFNPTPVTSLIFSIYKYFHLKAFVSLFSGISTSEGYLTTILEKEQYGYYLTHS